MTREEQICNQSVRYTKETHSPSSTSEFQAAMNIAVVKAFTAGAKWADENQPSPWISTDDYLPKINSNGYSDTVLAIDENNNIELAIYSFYRQDWIRADVKDNIDDSIIQNNITHWKIIPTFLKR